MVEKQTVPHVFLGLEKGGAFLQLPKLSKRYCKKYANMACIYSTMNLLYFNMSYTLIVFTYAVLTLGMFLADLTTFSFLSPK